VYLDLRLALNFSVAGFSFPKIVTAGDADDHFPQPARVVSSRGALKPT
jgi:hypothetical protein